MSDDYVLWGFQKARPLPPIKLTGGNLSHCQGEARQRTASGWETAIYRAGTRPTGLRIRAGMEA